MHRHRVAEWMSTPPIVVAPTTSLAAAQRIMEQCHVRRLPVVRDGKLIGIITRGDLRAAQPSGATTLSVYEWRALLDKVTVSECMTPNPLTIPPDAAVLEAAREMLTHKISGLPVVEGGKLIGVITESDLFRLLIAEEMGATEVDLSGVSLSCRHCGAILRGRSYERIGAEDTCWSCHYHLHRCENCRYSNGVSCMLGRTEQLEAIPGQRCSSFTYLSPRVAALPSAKS